MRTPYSYYSSRFFTTDGHIFACDKILQLLSSPVYSLPYLDREKHAKFLRRGIRHLSSNYEVRFTFTK